MWLWRGGKVGRFGFKLETLDLTARLILRVSVSYFITLKYCKGLRFKCNFSWFYQRSQTVLGCNINHHGPTCANYNMKMISKKLGYYFWESPSIFHKKWVKMDQPGQLGLPGTTCPHIDTVHVDSRLPFLLVASWEKFQNTNKAKHRRLEN